MASLLPSYIQQLIRKPLIVNKLKTLLNSKKIHHYSMTPETTATFAAGCFWSVELAYQRLPGVLTTSVGYIGGSKDNPTYREVCSGTTGHAEAVQVTFDADQISYGDLLRVFWKKHDPTTPNRQGNDVGSQYRSAIFYHTEGQKEEAEASKTEHQQSHSRPIVTQIVAATTFWPAEEYHQRYLEKGGQCASKGATDPIRCYG